jgi:hypothetical protein
MKFMGVAFLMFILSCSSASVGGSGDEWLRPLPKAMVQHLQSNERQAFRVAPENRTEAVTKLTSVPFLSLTLEEAEAWVGQPIDEGEIFLVRGLCLGCGKRSFKAYFDGKYVLVYSFSLAQRGSRPTRWPVVVGLKGPPEQVYVEYGSAQ